MAPRQVASGPGLGAPLLEPLSDYPQASEKASIHRLMEGFLLRLQAQFPSTVSTVYRCVCAVPAPTVWGRG